MGELDVNKRVHWSTPGISEILGLDHVADGGLGDLVVFDGGSAFEFSSNVVAMLSHQQGLVEVFSV